MLRTAAVLVMIVALVFPWANSFADDDHHGEDHICFTRIDADQDDVASFEEFAKVFGKDQDKYNAMDLDGDGKLTHDEYEDYHYNQEG